MAALLAISTISVILLLAYINLLFNIQFEIFCFLHYELFF